MRERENGKEGQREKRDTYRELKLDREAERIKENRRKEREIE